ncbi:MAG TPA: hypothetical protein VKD23_07100 [Terriglobales bacterium]|nr:hypothetical protein [Terriglobales bacterium]
MNIKTSLIYTVSLALAVSSIAESKDKKKHSPRGMVESMQSVPCGAKERGLSGLGSVFGSVGVQHVNSHEQLCPQYLFRTDEMEYHIRPLDTKHAVLLPVGHEGEYKIKKDRLYLRAVDGDRKVRPYQVVSMQPLNSESKGEDTSSRYDEKPEDSRRNRQGREGDRARVDSREGDKTSDPPPQHWQ